MASHNALCLPLLALLAPQPAEPQVMKTCAGNAAATLRPEQPYRALWNAAFKPRTVFADIPPKRPRAVRLAHAAAGHGARTSL